MIKKFSKNEDLSELYMINKIVAVQGNNPFKT